MSTPKSATSNHSSVPSGQITSGKGLGAPAGNGKKNVDSIIMYCSYFSYCSDSAIARKDITQKVDV